MSDSIVVLFQVYHVATIGFKLEISQPATKCLTRIMSWKSFLSIHFTQPQSPGLQANENLQSQQSSIISSLSGGGGVGRDFVPCESRWKYGDNARVLKGWWDVYKRETEEPGNTCILFPSFYHATLITHPTTSPP